MRRLFRRTKAETKDGQTAPAVSLREIVYLDRDRVDSYISQLAGGVVVNEMSSVSRTKGLSANLAAGAGIAGLKAGAEKKSETGYATTRIPAHAVLSLLEARLRETNLLADASVDTVVPGQIVVVHGDTTFESWELLAQLGDSVQGVATLVAKIFAARRAAADLSQIRDDLKELEKLVKRLGPRSDLDEPTRQLASRVSSMRTGYEIVDSGYINDVKEIAKLFFRDQNLIRISTRHGTLVGQLRRDCLIGGTTDEFLFTYGSRPTTAFTALVYVGEFGRDVELSPDELMTRLQAALDSTFTLGTLQTLIREMGSTVLEYAEELRRPVGGEAIFVVPLAVYREVNGPSPR